MRVFRVPAKETRGAQERPVAACSNPASRSLLLITAETIARQNDASYYFGKNEVDTFVGFATKVTLWVLADKANFKENPAF
jgi:hypothetical protein